MPEGQAPGQCSAPADRCEVEAPLTLRDPGNLIPAWAPFSVQGTRAEWCSGVGLWAESGTVGQQGGGRPRRPTMAARHPHALQDTFLEHVRKHDVPVTVFLASGIRLQGTVAGFDSYALLLVRDRQSQLIYKHAISTIVPSGPDRMATSQDVRSRPA